MSKLPCTPNCPRRRFDCHFAGHCPDYDAATKQVAAEKAADAPRVKGMRDAYAVLRRGYEKTVRNAHDRKMR